MNLSDVVKQRLTVRLKHDLPEGLEINCFLGDSPEEFRAAVERALADHERRTSGVRSKDEVSKQRT